MNAVFADTFFWIAFTNVQDEAHERADPISFLGTICTTEEVLTEYLNFFSGWGYKFRQKAAANVENILSNPNVRVLAQSSSSFRSGTLSWKTQQRIQV